MVRAALGPEAANSVDESSVLPWGPLGAGTDLLSDRRLAVLVGRAMDRLRAGAAPSRDEIKIYRGAAIYLLWDRFGARLQKIIDDDGVDAPFYGDFVAMYRELLVHPAIRVPEPPHLLALYYQARRAAWFITCKIAGRSRAAGESREAIWRATLEDLFERMNGTRVHMPPLRELSADGGLLDYVDRFVGARIDDPDERRRLSFHVMKQIQEKLGAYPWPRNLRELRNFTERCLLEDRGPSSIAPPSDGRQGPQAPLPLAPLPPTPLPAPQSVCMPSSGLLGPRAKAGEVDHKKLLSAYVTHVYVSTGQNKAATARITGFDRRTVAQLIDEERLARLLDKAKRAG